MIGGKAPSDYLLQLQTHSAVQLDDAGMNLLLASHCIDPATLRQNDFEGFVAARKRILLTKIETVMGKTIVISDEAVPEDEADEEE